MSASVDDASTRCSTTSGDGLVRSWGDAGWRGRPAGGPFAPLIGAKPGEVLVADTLTFLIAKLIGAALEQRPDRHVVLTDAANFHSDIYIIEAMCERGPARHDEDDRPEHLDEELNDDVALVEFTQVDYRTGESLDMPASPKVHEAGALMLWDFAHSAGAVPLDVRGRRRLRRRLRVQVPQRRTRAPAFLYVRKSWQGQLRNPLPGWLGHARPFDFELTYEPAEGMQAFVTSSPSIVALAALDGALDVWDRTSMNEVRAKSLALTDLFIQLVEERLPGVFDVVTPLEHARRAARWRFDTPRATPSSRR